jgi:adenine deaminase
MCPDNLFDFEISALLIDLSNRQILPRTVRVRDGIISEIKDCNESDVNKNYLCPGFVDAHVHCESSLLTPSGFARLAVRHGTVATVSDPHEIANVLGVPGVEYMIENASQVNFKMHFGAPSCVPATVFETAGAALGVKEVSALLKRKEIYYLAEVMNFPGVLAGDENLLAMITKAKELGKPIDGHAPGLRGNDAMRYASAGPSTDHECFMLDEALDKIKAGMKIAIREGSAAKNFEALKSLLKTHPEVVMFCSDDKHPDVLETGHINEIVRRAVADGFDLFDVLRAACVTPVEHYNLPVGQLRVGDAADFVLLSDLENFKVIGTYINGEKVYDGKESFIAKIKPTIVNNFSREPIAAKDIELVTKTSKVRAIQAISGELVTKEIVCKVEVENGLAVSSPANDVLKIVVINRYDSDSCPAVAFVKGFGLKNGALASSVAHDSHNIVAVGCSDLEIVEAVNAVISAKGGLSLAVGGNTAILPLPIAGLMSDADPFKVAKDYRELDRRAKEEFGSKLPAPFMTLSFMALLVIPELKLSDKGLFDGREFKFTDLFI